MTRWSAPIRPPTAIRRLLLPEIVTALLWLGSGYHVPRDQPIGYFTTVDPQYHDGLVKLDGCKLMKIRRPASGQLEIASTTAQ